METEFLSNDQSGAVPADSDPQPVTRFVRVVHDTIGEMRIPYDALAEVNPDVTVLRLLSRADLNVPGQSAVFVNGQRAAMESVVQPGDEVYIAGKLQGGRP